MDCTLRDGGNVVGDGYDEKLTRIILDGLTECGVPIIEFGNAKGLGAYALGWNKALTDEEYFRIARDYDTTKTDLGMFLNAKRYSAENVRNAAKENITFLRVGADAGDADKALEAVKTVKENGLKAFYSLMKAYLLDPKGLAEEARKLEAAGIDEITVMDSAGTMFPEQVAEYVKELKKAVSVPVGFHCHNNLGLSGANALAAYENGADILDCGLMGMARSAGNLATELCVALMHRRGEMQDIDLFRMLSFIETKLQPEMEKHDYHNAIKPLDITLGFSGCHSGFVKTFRSVAEEEDVSLLKLIAKVSETNRKNPTEELMKETAKTLR